MHGNGILCEIRPSARLPVFPARARRACGPDWELEAWVGIEPAYAALQAAASPLCHPAGDLLLRIEDTRSAGGTLGGALRLQNTTPALPRSSSDERGVGYECGRK